MRKILLGVIGFVAFGAILYGFIFWSASTGAPFISAKTYLTTSSEVVSYVGKVSSVGLLPATTYRERSAGSQGEAQFDVEVVGTAGKKTAQVQMHLQNGVWKPGAILIDGKVVPLN